MIIMFHGILCILSDQLLFLITWGKYENITGAMMGYFLGEG